MLGTLVTDALDKTSSRSRKRIARQQALAPPRPEENIVSELLNIIRVDRLIAARYCNFNCWCLAGDSNPNPEGPEPKSGASANFASEAMLVDGEGFEPPLDLSISRFTGGRLQPLG